MRHKSKNKDPKTKPRAPALSLPLSLTFFTSASAFLKNLVVASRLARTLARTRSRSPSDAPFQASTPPTARARTPPAIAAFFLSSSVTLDRAALPASTTDLPADLAAPTAAPAASPTALTAPVAASPTFLTEREWRGWGVGGGGREG